MRNPVDDNDGTDDGADRRIEDDDGDDGTRRRTDDDGTDDGTDGRIENEDGDAKTEGTDTTGPTDDLYSSKTLKYDIWTKIIL